MRIPNRPKGKWGLLLFVFCGGLTWAGTNDGPYPEKWKFQITLNEHVADKNPSRWWMEKVPESYSAAITARLNRDKKRVYELLRRFQDPRAQELAAYFHECSFAIVRSAADSATNLFLVIEGNPAHAVIAFLPKTVYAALPPEREKAFCVCRGRLILVPAVEMPENIQTAFLSYGAKLVMGRNNGKERRRNEIEALELNVDLLNWFCGRKYYPAADEILGHVPRENFGAALAGIHGGDLQTLDEVLGAASCGREVERALLTHHVFALGLRYANLHGLKDVQPGIYAWYLSMRDN